MINIKIGGGTKLIKKITLLMLLIFTITLISGTVSAANPYNTTLISNSSTVNGGNHESNFPSVSADGSIIVYSSTSTNLIVNKTTTSIENIFMFNKSSGKTTLVTKGLNGNGGNRDSYHPAISGDGTIIAFTSCASDLLPGRVLNNHANLYTYNITSGITELITEGPGGTGVDNDCGWPSINYDGTAIAFESAASDVYTGFTKKSTYYEIFVSYVDEFGIRNIISINNQSLGNSRYPSISANGKLITYLTDYGRLPDNSTSTYQNIVVYDMDTEINYLVSYGALFKGGNHPSSNPSISADGSTIVFASRATDMLWGTLTNINRNIFVCNLYTWEISLITRGSSGNGGNGYSSCPTINEDGTIITFYSAATDLVPGITTNGKENIFMYNMTSGEMSLMSQGNGGKGGNGNSFYPTMTYNGNTIVYQSSASDLIKGKTITGSQIYVTYVNNGPLAVNDTAITTEDTNVIIPVLNNDSDEDGDTLSISGTSTPLHGTITINSDKTITYKPNLNYYGLDSFSYTITDGKNGFSTAIVNITVTPVNDAPIALNDSKTTLGNTSVTIPVLLNDSDVENDPLTVSGTSAALHGLVTINPNNTITYTPNPGFAGHDSFTYTISDGNGGTDTATVNITVNNPPVAVNDAFNITNTASANINVTSNDMDPDGDLLTVSIFSNPLHGKVTVNGTNIIYTPNTGYFGSDSFKYTINDGHGGTSTATVLGNITDNTSPQIVLNYPKNGAKSISRTSTIYIKFSENIKSSINWSKIVVKNSRGQTVSISKWISGNTLYIKQSKKRTAYSYYTVYIPASAIQDYAGNRFAVNYAFKFKTGA
jgi:hypothetical protein